MIKRAALPPSFIKGVNMYIDISSNQGAIDWPAVAQNKDIKGVILRSTTKNNKLDVRLIENYNGILQNIIGQLDELSVYKFSYARDYETARIEAMKCTQALAHKGIHYDFLYLDLEGFAGRDYTADEANAVIMAYFDHFRLLGEKSKLRLYFNFNYAKNIVDKMWYFLPLWIARYNSKMGEVTDWNVVLWQYTSKGSIAGITGDVDLSKEIKT